MASAVFKEVVGAISEAQGRDLEPMTFALRAVKSPAHISGGA